jgi:molybdopterin converting factor small subunit
MTITVQLFATFRNGRFKEAQMQFADAVTLGQVVAELGITVGEVGMVLVNGRHASMEQELCEGQLIALFPMLSGG